MPEDTKQGAFAKQTLNNVEFTAIRGLADSCASCEDLDLRLSWNMLQSRASDVTEDFLYYTDDLLVGFLTLFGVGSDEAEATGMVHPEYRRKGVFTALLTAAGEESRRNGTKSLVFACDRRSAAAKAFLEASGAHYDFSEQKMRLETPVKRVSPDNHLDFRQATIDDADAIAQLISDDSGMDAAFFRQVVANGIRNRSRWYYIAKLDGQTIGTINIDVIDGDSYIYGFVIRPEYRGRGYGRQMLVRTIDTIVVERPQPVFLEVETDNDVALALYYSFGFTIINTYDYYRIEI
jgi:ribosomal protein S18 acetylase RimI-like enzyme